MKICVPVTSNNVENISISGHFGSAPFYAIYDSDTHNIDIHENDESSHEHGMCNPAQTVIGLGAKAMIIGGIGYRALMKLQDSGIKVYHAQTGNFKTEIDRFDSGKMETFSPASSCQGHH